MHWTRIKLFVKISKLFEMTKFRNISCRFVATAILSESSKLIGTPDVCVRACVRVRVRMRV